MDRLLPLAAAAAAVALALTLAVLEVAKARREGVHTIQLAERPAIMPLDVMVANIIIMMNQVVRFYGSSVCNNNYNIIITISIVCTIGRWWYFRFLFKKMHILRALKSCIRTCGRVLLLLLYYCAGSIILVTGSGNTNNTTTSS